MGYSASTWEVDFSIPADKVGEALAAVNALEPTNEGYSDLVDAVEEGTGFHDCELTESGFRLGHHSDKWFEYTEKVLCVLARFAVDGSFVRFQGEDGELFGYQVVDGDLMEEIATVSWCVAAQPQDGGVM